MSTTNTAVPNSSSIVTRIASLTTPWADMAPENKFSGMTLAEFKTSVAPSLDIRQAVASLRAQLKAQIGAQRDADKTSRMLCSRVVSAVKGDQTLGPNSTLYRAMGFIPTDERKSPRAAAAQSPQKAPAAQVAPAAAKLS